MSGERYDQVTEREIAQREAAVGQVRRNVAGDGAEICADCGEGIPRERRAALPSARRCIDCETEREHRARLR